MYMERELEFSPEFKKEEEEKNKKAALISKVQVEGEKKKKRTDAKKNVCPSGKRGTMLEAAAMNMRKRECGEAGDDKKKRIFLKFCWMS